MASSRTVRSSGLGVVGMALLGCSAAPSGEQGFERAENAQLELEQSAVFELDDSTRFVVATAVDHVHAGRLVGGAAAVAGGTEVTLRVAGSNEVVYRATAADWLAALGAPPGAQIAGGNANLSEKMSLVEESPGYFRFVAGAPASLAVEPRPDSENCRADVHATLRDRAGNVAPGYVVTFAPSHVGRTVAVPLSAEPAVTRQTQSNGLAVNRFITTAAGDQSVLVSAEGLAKTAVFSLSSCAQALLTTRSSADFIVYTEVGDPLPNGDRPFAVRTMSPDGQPVGQPVVIRALGPDGQLFQRDLTTASADGLAIAPLPGGLFRGGLPTISTGPNVNAAKTKLECEFDVKGNFKCKVTNDDIFGTLRDVFCKLFRCDPKPPPEPEPKKDLLDFLNKGYITPFDGARGIPYSSFDPFASTAPLDVLKPPSITSPIGPRFPF